MKISCPSQPTRTAIVGAYNEGKYLSGVLGASLTTPAIHEIIVVDDGSQDRIAEIIRQYFCFPIAVRDMQ